MKLILSLLLISKGSLLQMLSRQMLQASANIVINRLFPENYFFTILDIRLFETAHPLSLCTYFRLEKKWIFAIDAKK